MPTQPDTRNATRHGDDDRQRRCDCGISQLHHVGGVGAEHHQLAVRHVDDAHHAEGDGEADGREHQHRAQAQAEEQRLHAEYTLRDELIAAITSRAGVRTRSSLSG